MIQSSSAEHTLEIHSKQAMDLTTSLSQAELVLSTLVLATIQSMSELAQVLLSTADLVLTISASEQMQLESLSLVQVQFLSEKEFGLSATEIPLQVSELLHSLQHRLDISQFPAELHLTKLSAAVHSILQSELTILSLQDLTAIQSLSTISQSPSALQSMQAQAMTISRSAHLPALLQSLAVQAMIQSLSAKALQLTSTESLAQIHSLDLILQLQSMQEVAQL